jgi:hypothetical protein
VYTYPDFWQHLTVAGSLEGYGDYPLWIADYAKDGNGVPRAFLARVLRTGAGLSRRRGTSTTGRGSSTC